MVVTHLFILLFSNRKIRNPSKYSRVNYQQGCYFVVVSCHPCVVYVLDSFKIVVNYDCGDKMKACLPVSHR